jgi:CRP-like cAMP-binding protein
MVLPEKRLLDFPLFHGAGAREAARLVRAARPRQLAPGELYVAYGSPLAGLPFLLSGSLKLSMDRGSVKRVFRIVGAGESFCEASALLRAPTPFDVVALERAEVLAIAVDRIERLAERDKVFGRSLVRLLAQRALAAIRDLDAGTLPSRERVASYLAASAQSAARGGWHVGLPVTKTILAARLGMKKETLSRVLRDLAQEQLIAVSGRDISILDRDRLLGAARGG